MVSIARFEISALYPNPVLSACSFAFVYAIHSAGPPFIFPTTQPLQSNYPFTNPTTGTIYPAYSEISPRYRIA
jgi:hypothetical protein